MTTRRGVLHAVEIDAATVIREWLASRSAMLRDIALRGTWLDAEDVSELLGLSLPGIDELAGLIELMRIGRSGRYDVIVVDTAPTGHTLRMLAMPETLGRVAAVFDLMQDKHRAIVAALRGRWTPDAADAFVLSLSDDAVELSRLIRDPDRTRVTWVGLAEHVAIAETLAALRALAQDRVPVAAIILNRLTPDGRRGCRFCAARRRLQQAATAMLITQLPDAVGGAVPVTGLADRTAEPTGIAALSALSREIAAGASPAAARRRSATSKTVITGTTAARATAAALTDVGTAALVLFGGKGGVGKTTCAAATAIALASASPSRRVLLLSADPAHSLGDVLGRPVGNEPQRIAGGPANLAVRELDAGLALQARPRRVRDGH